MPNTIVPVLVFGSGLTGTGVVRSLGRAKTPAFTFCAPSELLVHSRWYRQLPDTPSQCPKPEELADFLSALLLPRAVLMPCADDWIKAVSELPSALRERFPASCSCSGVIDQLVDKWLFAEMLMREGLAHPRTQLLYSLDQMSETPASFYEGGFLKPLSSLEFGRRHHVKAFMIKDKTDALATMKKTQEMSGSDFPIMLQEYIPGPPTNHYFVDGFVDREGTIQALFPRKRLRMYPPLLGNSTLMETVELSEVAGAIDTIKRMWTALKYRGIFSAEFKYDDRDGLFKILEVNARPWWFIEFATRCGVDVCNLSYRDALGLPVEPIKSYAIGRRCVFLPKDYKAYRLDFQGSGSLLDWTRSWFGAEEALCCWDDPGPAISYVSTALKEHFERKAGQ